MKRLFVLTLALTAALSACQAASSPTAGTAAPATAQSAPPTVAQSAPTAASLPPATAASSPAASASPSAAAVPAGCTVISPQPTPGPTEQSLFPTVSESDWVQGPADASVTITEYSDFQ